ncbi:unnamed protein product [Paramecium pentaurelia]|uniref:Uncharacterized protein n=1 Tax=Paramecium pentaurelia TaxID=43138 RepID=A0A8S1WA21_9CILI|nr:unnamed protein product [Paramecium pentaurelia]
MDENNKCKPICGDGIIEQGLEDCEDFNDIQYDGCYQCMFQCEINCSKCLKGICQQCVDGYELLVEGCQKIFIKQNDDLEEQDIKIQCGDGNQSKTEQCDDGNKEDGCSSKSEIEGNWDCNLEQPNIGYLITKFSLIYLNQTYDHQYVQLQFTNQMKQIQKFNFTQSILTEIYNLSQDQYQVIINPVVNVYETQFTMAIFEFDILNLESISFSPNLSVSFNSSLIDNNYMAADLSKQKILLQQPKYQVKTQLMLQINFKTLEVHQ